MAALFIDPIDFAGLLYGSGGKALASYAISCMGEKFDYVGYTSAPLKIGEWTQIKLYGKNIRFLPVATAAEIDATKIGFKNIRFTLALVKHIKALKKSNSKAVFTHAWPVLWLFSHLLRKWNVCFDAPGLANPSLFRHRNIFERFILNPMFNYIQITAFNKANVVFAAADNTEIQRYLKSIGKLKITKPIISLPTAVNTDIFSPKSKDAMRNAKKLPSTKKIFIFIGRLSRVKGIDFLMQALNEFNHKFGDGMLLILGQGECKDELENFCDKMRLRECVKFLGNLPPQEVAEFVGLADACIVGSLTEGFSNSMVEALACGRPIVSTDVSGASEIIKEGVNGFIVKERNPIIFSEKMNEALYLKDAENYSRQLALKNYSKEILWKKVEEMWPVFK